MWGGAVDSITFPFKKSSLPTRSEARKAYNLGEPTFLKTLDGGKYLECYDFPKGIGVLTGYNGGAAPVEKVIYFSPRQYIINVAGVSGVEHLIFFGVRYRKLKASEKQKMNLRDETLFVEGVFPYSPADKQNIKQGDLILSVNGKKFNDYKKMSEYFDQARKKGPVRLELFGGNGIAVQDYISGRDNVYAAFRYYYDEAQKFKENKEYGRALTLLNKVAYIYPEKKFYINLLVFLLAERGEYDKAKDALLEVLKDEPDNIGILNSLSIVSRYQCNLDDAIHYRKRIVELDPEDIKTQEKLDEMYAEKQNKQLKDQPAVTIEKVWMEHNVYENIDGYNKKGLKIHIKFSVNNMRGDKLRAGVFFYNNADNKGVSGKKGIYSTPEGVATVQETIVPKFNLTTFTDFTLFFPYYAFEVPTGKYDLHGQIYIYKAGGSIYADQKINFDFNR